MLPKKQCGSLLVKPIERQVEARASKFNGIRECPYKKFKVCSKAYLSLFIKVMQLQS